jgi:hypothetical protein
VKSRKRRPSVYRPSIDEVNEHLRSLRRGLERLSQDEEIQRRHGRAVVPFVPEATSQYVQQAITAYLDGKAPSLDAAFGAINKGGRPVTVDHLRIAQIAAPIWFDHQSGPVPWDQIMSALRDAGMEDLEPEQVKRAVEREGNRVISDRITPLLDASNHLDPQKKT